MSRQQTTATHQSDTARGAATGPVAAAKADEWITTGRAARELGLRRTEFDLAVRLGRVRTAPGRTPGERRVARAEIERLRAGPDAVEELRRSVRAVGTAEGAALLGVPKTRFTRLARLGLLVPVAFYLNRYRAVVWLYLAAELRLFGEDDENAPLLTGRTPEGLRGLLDAGIDLRPRNWRSRHLGFLLREAENPWARAGAVASFLEALHVAQVVRDPYDRSHLHGFRRRPPGSGNPDSPGAQIAAGLMTAHDPDEIAWLRADLAHLVEEARAHSPAPRPSASHRPVLVPERSASDRPVQAPEPPVSRRPARAPKPLASRRTGSGPELPASCRTASTSNLPSLGRAVAAWESSASRGDGPAAEPPPSGRAVAMRESCGSGRPGPAPESFMSRRAVTASELSSPRRAPAESMPPELRPSGPGGPRPARTTAAARRGSPTPTDRARRRGLLARLRHRIGRTATRP